MQKSKFFFIITLFFAVCAFYTTFYGFFVAGGAKFSDVSQTNLLQTNQTQWFTRKGKVVMILLDALRFDYLFPNGDIVGNKQFPQNKLKKLNEAYVKSPENFVIMRARADAPTMTVNRIPCIATGNIPPKDALLEALQASPAVEDNLPKQLRMLGRKSYFAGDPLWAEYFPKDFTETCLAEGFNLKDTTVDHKSIRFVNSKINDDNFDLILGHMLSVDHMGHAYGLADPRMAEQIAANDQVISDIIETIDDDTTLVILGDHGVLFNGVHGGGSLDETSTAIVAYHKKGFQKYQQKGLSKVMRSINETTLSVKQQDIAPTLAMLMGTPIPFSNMGQIINDIYPTNDYTGDCAKTAFEAQMLQDNYLNSLQIRKYAEKFQLETHLFSAQEVAKINNRAQEVDSLYQKAMGMYNDTTQCEFSAFQEAAINGVLSSQKFSEEVYSLVRDSGAFDMPLVYQGIALSVLVLMLWILVIQYIYRNSHDEKDLELWNRKNLSTLMKKSAGLVVALSVLSVIVWFWNKKRAYCVTAGVIFTALWFFGILCQPFFVAFVKRSRGIKQQQKEAIQEKGQQEELTINDLTSSVVRVENLMANNNNLENFLIKEDEERQFRIPPLLQSNLPFLLKSPLYTLAAIGIIVSCVISVHLGSFDKITEKYVDPASPFIVLLCLAYRVHKLFPHKFNPVVPLTFVACLFLFFKNIMFTSERLRISLGLILILDFVWDEIYQIVKKKTSKKLWGAAFLTCFGLLIPYHLIDNSDNYLVEIVIPRLLWAALLGIAIASCFLLKEIQALKKNLQLCLILYLILLQKSSEVISFAVVLTMMRVCNQLFKNVKPLNYLYPLTMALLCQFGLHILKHDDFHVPSKFDQGFIGLHDFNIVLSPLMIVLNITTSYILGLSFMGYYNENEEKIALNQEHWEVIKKRNIILFIFMFSVIYFGAAVKCYFWRYFFLEEAQEKFVMDSAIYFLVTIGGFSMF